MGSFCCLSTVALCAGTAFYLFFSLSNDDAVPLVKAHITIRPSFNFDHFQKTVTRAQWPRRLDENGPENASEPEVETERVFGTFPMHEMMQLLQHARASNKARVVAEVCGLADCVEPGERLLTVVDDMSPDELSMAILDMLPVEITGGLNVTAELHCDPSDVEDDTCDIEVLSNISGNEKQRRLWGRRRRRRRRRRRIPPPRPNSLQRSTKSLSIPEQWIRQSSMSVDDVRRLAVTRSVGPTCFSRLVAAGPSRIRGRDSFGAGHFGASRGHRLHSGVDINVPDRSSVQAPFPLEVVERRYPYSNDPAAYNDGLLVRGIGAYSSIWLMIWYISPTSASQGTKFYPGQSIGMARSLRCNRAPTVDVNSHRRRRWRIPGCGYPCMTPSVHETNWIQTRPCITEHIHLELFHTDPGRPGSSSSAKNIDPTGHLCNLGSSDGMIAFSSSPQHTGSTSWDVSTPPDHFHMLRFDLTTSVLMDDEVQITTPMGERAATLNAAGPADDSMPKSPPSVCLRSGSWRVQFIQVTKGQRSQYQSFFMATFKSYPYSRILELCGAQARLKYYQPAIHYGSGPCSGSMSIDLKKLGDGEWITDNAAVERYGPNQNCYWTISTRRRFSVRTQYRHLNLEVRSLADNQKGCWDRVKEFDGGKFKQEWCANNIGLPRDGGAWTSDSNYIKLQFLTDHVIHGYGFAARVVSVDAGISVSDPIIVIDDGDQNPPTTHPPTSYERGCNDYKSGCESWHKPCNDCCVDELGKTLADICNWGYRAAMVAVTVAAISSCFPADALVFTESGMTMRMDQIRIGQRLLTAAGTFADVYLQSHQDHSTIAPFIELTMQTGQQVSLSELHYIEAAGSMRQAQDVRVGMSVTVCPHHGHCKLSPVVSLRFVEKRGLFNPMTMSGTIVVNGVKVSCHSDWFLEAGSLLAPRHIPRAYQASLAPLRLLYKAWPGWVSRFHDARNGSHRALSELSTWELMHAAAAAIPPLQLRSGA